MQLKERHWADRWKDRFYRRAVPGDIVDVQLPKTKKMVRRKGVHFHEYPVTGDPVLQSFRHLRGLQMADVAL